MSESQQYCEVPDLETLREKVRIETYRSSGPGGQRRDKKETAVRIRYTLPQSYILPSGKEIKELVVIRTRERSQAQNINYALEELQRRLEELYRPIMPRIPTEEPVHAREENRDEKMRHSEKKRLRRKPIS